MAGWLRTKPHCRAAMPHVAAGFELSEFRLLIGGQQSIECRVRLGLRCRRLRDQIPNGGGSLGNSRRIVVLHGSAKRVMRRLHGFM